MAKTNCANEASADLDKHSWGGAMGEICQRWSLRALRGALRDQTSVHSRCFVVRSKVQLIRGILLMEEKEEQNNL